MRICLYTQTALPKIGGQELVVDALARQFQRLGQDVVVLAPRPRRPLQVTDALLPYCVVRHPRFFSSRFFVSCYRHWLLKLHQQHRFDILHCHGIYPPGYLAALCREDLGMPVIITSHGGDVYEGNARLARSVLRRRHVKALEAADALVAISRMTRDGMRRLCPHARRVVSIPNGVDVDAFLDPAPRPADLDPNIRPDEYVLFLGRLKRGKGVDLLLEALALLPDNGRVQLVIAGDGVERPALEAQAARLGLRRRVRFVGGAFGAVKAHLLQNALCTVIPSRWFEAFGLVVLESYASGTAVIATRMPGLEDLIQHERTGSLVSSESPNALARALRQVFEDRARVRKLGARARRFAQAYGWHAVAQQHLQLYGELCAAGPNPPLQVVQERIACEEWSPADARGRPVISRDDADITGGLPPREERRRPPLP